jgi:hypothetical protein
VNVRQLTEQALAIAASGWAVFPCHTSKKPLTKNGFKAATTKPATIQKLFANPDAALIAVPTGKTSFIALDIDANGLQWLHDNQTKLPLTRIHQTRSGGLHYLFTPPNNVKIPNSASKIAPGVDVRGDGGYVIVPPSPGYRALNNSPIALLPPWLSELLTTPPRPRFSDRLVNHPYKAEAITHRMAQAYENVARAPEGQRNQTLNRETFILACAAIQGHINAAEVEHLMLLAAQTSGLPTREALATINSAMRAAS